MKFLVIGVLATTSNRDLDDQSKRLMVNYLTTIHCAKTSLIAGGCGQNGHSTLVPIVARERYTGEYHAIQCKFFDPKHTLG